MFLLHITDMFFIMWRRIYWVEPKHKLIIRQIDTKKLQYAFSFITTLCLNECIQWVKKQEIFWNTVNIINRQISQIKSLSEQKLEKFVRVLLQQFWLTHSTRNSDFPWFLIFISFSTRKKIILSPFPCFLLYSKLCFARFPLNFLEYRKF